MSAFNFTEVIGYVQAAADWLLQSDHICGINITRGDLLGFITGVANVYLLTKQKIANWPWGIANVIIYTLIFYRENMPANAFLQIVYFALAIWGWYHWKIDYKRKKPLQPSHVTKKTALVLIVLTAPLCFLLYYIFHYMASDSKTLIFDAILTGASLSVTYMETQKFIEAWPMWVIIDSSYACLMIHFHLYFSAALYVSFVLLAIYGFYSWLQLPSIKDKHAPNHA